MYRLLVIQNAEVQTHVLSAETLRLQTKANVRYQILDEAGQLIAQPRTELLGNDLFVFIDEDAEAELVLENYSDYIVIEDWQDLQQLESTFATVQSVESMLASQVLPAQAGVSAGLLAVPAALGAVAAVSLSNGGQSDTAEKPAQPTAEEEKPAQPTAEEEKPAQPQAEEEKPTQSTAEEEKPAQPTAEEEKPAQSQAEEEKPAQPQAEEEKPAQPQAEEEKPAQPKAEEEKPAQPQAEEEKPAQPTAEEEKPAQPTAEEEKTAQPTAEEEKPAQPTAEEEKPAQPQAEEEKPVQPQAEEEQATQPTTQEQTPPLTPPSPASIRMDSITDDNVINRQEAGEDIVLKGSIAYDSGSDVRLNLMLDGETFAAQISGNQWQAVVAGAKLAQAQGDNVLQLQAITSNAAGSAEATQTVHYAVDTVITAPQIRINPITGDDVISYLESQNPKTLISGQVENVEGSAAKVGDSVIIRLGTTQHSTQLIAKQDGSLGFEIEVGTVALINHKDDFILQLSTQDAAQNTHTAQVSHQYQIDFSDGKVINVDHVTADNVLNDAESKGTVTLSGNVVLGETGDELVFLCACEACSGGWKTLEGVAKVDENGKFSLDVKGADLLTNNAVPTIKAVLKNNEAISKEKTYAIDTELSQPVTSIVIAEDNVINSVEAAGEVAIKGQLSVDNDVDWNSVAVRVKVGEEVMTAQVDAASRSWSLNLAANKLTALSKAEIGVEVAVKDAALNEAFYTHTQTFAVIDSNSKPVIRFNAISGDNLLNAQEIAEILGISQTELQGYIGSDQRLNLSNFSGDKMVTISGVVENGVAGQVLRIKQTLAGNKTQDHEAVIQADLSFSFQATAASVFHQLNTFGGANGSRQSRFTADYSADYGDGIHVAAEQSIYHLNWKASLPKFDITLQSIGIEGYLNQSHQEQGMVEITALYSNVANGDIGTAVLSLNGKTYSAADAIVGLERKLGALFYVPFAELEKAAAAGVNTLSVEATRSDNVGNSLSKTSNSQSFAIELSPPALALSTEDINGGNAINIAQAGKNFLISGSLSYDSAAVRSGTVEVSVEIHGQRYQAVVDESSQSWQLMLNAADNAKNPLASRHGEQTLKVYAKALGVNGNLAEAENSLDYAVDLTPPKTQLQLQTIGDVSADSTDTVLLTGQVLGEFQPSDKVSIRIHQDTYQVDIKDGGAFSLKVAANVLAGNPDLTVSASIESHDAAGNSQTVQSQAAYRIVSQNLHIQLDNITPDNLLNVSEAQAATTKISGTVSGADADAVSKVSLLINQQSFEADVQGGKFSLDVKTQDLLNNQDYRIVAQARSGNAQASAAKVYAVAPDAAASIDVTKIGENFSSTGAQMLRMNGEIRYSGIYAQGKNAMFVRELVIKAGDKSYKIGLDHSGKTFTFNLSAEDLKALDGKAISVEFNRAANSADENYKKAFELVDNKGVHSARKVTVENVEYESINFNSAFIQTDANGVQTFNAKALLDNTQISGQTTGASAGDTVEVQIGDKHFKTTVQADHSFSLEVARDVLAQNDEKSLTATLHSHDRAGNAISVQDTEAYLGFKTLSGDFVAKHGNIKQAERKLDHTAADYNFPYFINAQGVSGSYGYNTKIAVGGNEQRHKIYYYFVTAEDEATYGVKHGNLSIAGTYEQLSPTNQAIMRESFAMLSSYLNVEFVESSSYILDSSGINVSMAQQNSSAIAWAVNGGWVFWNKPMSKFDGAVAYFGLHEVGHSLTMSHTFGHSNDFAKMKEKYGVGAGSLEDHGEFSYMSYSYNYDLVKNDLRIYQLAGLQYRYGVNPNARAGDDVYTFGTYNVHSSDAGVYIWDGAGVDTFDASNEKMAVNVNLTPGSWSYRGAIAKTLTIKDKESYTLREFFDLADDAAVANNNALASFNSYTENQAFIGFGTQIENLIGSAHDDTLTGNKADNNIYGGKGRDTIKGGLGNDYIDGGEGADIMRGEGGDDTYVVDDAGDEVIELADEGKDSVLSLIDYRLPEHVENLTLTGTMAKSAIGNELDNILIANNVGARLEGMDGNDRLIGGLGADILVGGNGADTFVFQTALNGKVDIIEDFNPNEDRIELSKLIFTALANITQSEFADYIQYDQATGKLAYDSDGKGITDAIHFATLSNPLNSLQYEHFSIV